MIVNKYPGKCSSCKAPLAANEGFAYRNGSKWSAVCNSAACHRKLGLQIESAKEQIRLLDDSGFITMPYDPAALPLIHSMPGPNSKQPKWIAETKKWQVSTDPKDLPRVIEIAEKLQLKISEVLKEMSALGTPESREALERAECKRADGAVLFNYQKKGVEFLALHNRALLADQMGLGKSISNGTPVLTPNSWVPIEKLHIGDEVIGRDGKTHKVTGVYPQGKLTIFNVTFSDDRSVQCSGDHLWSVQTPNDRFSNPDKFRTHTLKEIIKAGLEDHNGNRKWFIPVMAPVELSEKNFPVHPYILGAMLANGSFGGVITHSGIPEQKQALEQLGVVFIHKDCYNKWTDKVCCDNLVKALKTYDLRRKNCYHKFIPEDYFWGSVEQRLALLQGLVDNDGTVAKDGMVVEYNTSSKQLSQDVIRLVRSLGGVVTFSTRKPKYTYKGEVKIGSTDHRIRIKLPNNFCPVTIPCKKGRFVANTKYPPALSIADITEAGESECTCISVDAADQLFVTKDYIVTHNTVQTLVSLPKNKRVILVSPAALKYNWERELKLWRSDYKSYICNGKNSFRLPEINEVIILNYEILPDWLKPTKEEKTSYGKKYKVAELSQEQIDKLSETVLIADEIQFCKNWKSARTQKFTQLSERCEYVWELTGTPLDNKPEDLYGIMQAGNMKVFKSWSHFVTLFNGYKNDFGGYEFGMPSPEVPELLKKVMLRRLKSEVLKELPPKIYQDINIEIDNETIKQLNKFLIEAGLAPDKVENLVEALDGIELPSFKQFSSIRALLAKSRIPAMLTIVEEYEESEIPLVVFSAHTAPIEALKNRPGWEIITGETSAEQRFKIVDLFQEGKLKGVGLTIGAGGVGLTLTRGSNILFVDLAWKPSMNIQSEDRLHRIGTKANKILIKRLCSNHPLDLHIQKLLAWKVELAYRSLEVDLQFNPTNTQKNITLVEETDEELQARMQLVEDTVERESAIQKLNRVLERESVKVSHIPEPKLTQSKKEILKEALSYMMGRCDGAIERDGMGFNKPDALMCRWIIASGLRDEDDQSFRVLERILCRYRRQLNDFEGIWKD